MSQPQVLKAVEKYGIVTFPAIQKETGLSKGPLVTAIKSLEYQEAIKSIVYKGRYKVYMSLEVYNQLFRIKCRLKSQ